ncbi:hypothetical protein llap_18329 [Limosa lapponica baueri]|uniref:Endothelial cell-specific chemotaxis regulator n=1 Tax=Limosa lapponica baueri TaxID=1758121 RepID=A0A2I0TC38_LIMLA|nr:hypothetical protein llap_18329 [Limosa lapponica baueri]
MASMAPGQSQSTTHSPEVKNHTSGVISFIVILIVVVIILVSVVSLRFKCNRSKDSEDKQKPGTSMVSERCYEAKDPELEADS